jgi:Mrp family chromosome partitioning ATPase
MPPDPHQLVSVAAEKLSSHLEPAGQEPVIVRCTEQLRGDALGGLWDRQLGPILTRLLTAQFKTGAAIVYVRAVERGDGATTVARQIAYAAARHAWCKALLLDADPGGGGQGACLGGTLPNLLEGFAAHGVLEVAGVGSDNAMFHAATMPPPSSTSEMLAISRLKLALAAEYNLVVLDCPPLLEQTYLTPLSSEPARVVMVLRAGRSRMSQALRARQEIEGFGAELFGAVLTHERRILPRVLDRLI